MIFNKNKIESQEEIEEVYMKKIEELDKQFLENIKNPQKEQSLQTIEDEYKKNLNVIKEKYEQQYLSYLQEQKNILIKNKGKKQGSKKQDNKNNKFVIKQFDFKLTKKERFLMKWELFLFKKKIKLKNFLRKKIPDSWKIFYLRLRIKIKSFFTLRKNLAEKDFQKKKSETIITATTLKNKILEISKKIYIKIKTILSNLLKKLIEFLKKFKKKHPEGEDKKEKRPEDEIVKKILEKK